MADKPWQLQLVRRSLKKKEKLRLLNRCLEIDKDSVNLDLGCAQGILSYFLRLKGGNWISVDLDMQNCRTAKDLLKNNVLQTGSEILPFKDHSLDRVVSLDFLEHLEKDDLCLREIHRILKKDGELVLAVPRTGKIYLLHKLKNLMGLKPEFYGHKREGYTLKDLRIKLKESGLSPVSHKSFSRFFAELLELLLNFLYIKFMSPDTGETLRDGHIRPSNEKEFESRKKAFKVYGWIYPMIWIITRLDLVFFFQRGYGLMVWAKK